MARLYAAARLCVNFFQPSFKLKEKRRRGAKVIKRSHAPSPSKIGARLSVSSVGSDAAVFAKTLGASVAAGELRDP
jgi:hypothetical protein